MVDPAVLVGQKRVRDAQALFLELLERGNRLPADDPVANPVAGRGDADDRQPVGHVDVGADVVADDEVDLLRKQLVIRLAGVVSFLLAGDRKVLLAENATLLGQLPELRVPGPKHDVQSVWLIVDHLFPLFLPLSFRRRLQPTGNP